MGRSAASRWSADNNCGLMDHASTLTEGNPPSSARACGQSSAAWEACHRPNEGYWSETEVVVVPMRRLELTDMIRYQGTLAVGLALYVGSFFAPAIAGSAVTPPGWAPGYICAFCAFVMPLQGLGFFGSDRLEFLSMLVSGWINPIFIVAMILALRWADKRPFAVLRIAVLAMIPFCWIVYYKERSYPREGHFLWILGMLLILFSQRRTAKLSEARPRPT